MYSNVKVLCGAVMMVAMVGTAGTRAEAAIIVQEGLVGGSGDVDNVLFGPSNCDGVSNVPGTKIQGCLNSDSSFLIDFTSDEPIFADASGQATIKASDGGFSFLQIDPVGDATFFKLQLNIIASEDGSIFFTGAPGGDSMMFSLTGNGSNFFTITGEDEFSSVSFTTTSDIVADVRQVRLGAGDGPGTGPDPIPEPTSLVLFGLGLLGAGVAGRRIRS